MRIELTSLATLVSNSSLQMCLYASWFSSWWKLWEETTSMENYPNLIGKYRRQFLDWYWCRSVQLTFCGDTSGMVVLDSIRRQTEQAVRKRPVVCIPPQSLLTPWLQGPALSPGLASLDDNYKLKDEINSFLMVFNHSNRNVRNLAWMKISPIGLCSWTFGLKLVTPSGKV